MALFLCLAASGLAAAKSRQPADGITTFDHDGVKFQLPGAWQETKAEPGDYELHRGDNDQLIVSLMSPIAGLDVATSAERLSAIQEKAIGSQCVSGFHVESRRVGPAALRVQASCDKPRMLATLLSAAAGQRVLSFEHYRYDPVSRPSLEQVDAVLLGAIRTAANSALTSCPKAILEAINGTSGCLEPAALGDDVVAACAKKLEQRGYVRDEKAAKTIGSQTGKKITCYRRHQ